MENVGKIKDLYISPEFVTEKTMNESLFTRINCQGGGENCPYSENDDMGKNTYDTNSKDNFGENPQENNHVNTNSQDVPPSYSQNGEKTKEMNDTERAPSKEYAAWEQYKKYLEKHNRYVGLAKKGD